MDCMSYLAVRDILDLMLLSRRFFHLGSGVLRQRTFTLFYQGGASLSFEIGLPSDAYWHRHDLVFSHLEPIPSSQVIPNLLPSTLSSTSTSSSSETDASGADSDVDHESSSSPDDLRAPHLSFKFQPGDVAFPVHIDVPYETFRTVLWGVYVNRPITSGSKYISPVDPGSKALIHRGQERIRKSSFAPTPKAHTFRLSPSPTSSVSMTLLPWSEPTAKHRLPQFVYAHPRRMYPRLCTCNAEASPRYALKFDALTVSCASLLRAQEEASKRDGRLSVVYL